MLGCGPRSLAHSFRELATLSFPASLFSLGEGTRRAHQPARRFIRRHSYPGRGDGRGLVHPEGTVGVYGDPGQAWVTIVRGERLRYSQCFGEERDGLLSGVK